VPALIAALTWEAVRLAAGSDVIHAHWVYPGGIAGLAAAKIRSKPLVLTSHGGDLNLSRRSRPLRALSAWVARHGRVCIGVSHAMTKEFRKLGVSEDRIRFVPLGIDAGDAASSNKPSAALREYAEFQGLRVVYVGSLIPLKSVQTLLDAIHQLRNHQRDVCCAIVGEGPEEAALRRLVCQLNLPVIFAGVEPPSAVGQWIKASQILVLPSRSEGRGLVLAEALARGIPVVASDIPGVDELAIDGVTGLRFAAGNAHHLAVCLERLMDDPELRGRLGKQGAELVQSEALTPRSSARRHMAVYDEFRLGMVS
jgi:glycosyltransferase involved in cell wall biosynthesis